MLRQRSTSLSKDLNSHMLSSSSKSDSTFMYGSTAMIRQKIDTLFGCKNYDDCAAVIRSLDRSVVEPLLSELPIADFIDAIPYSFVVIDALYSKASDLGPKCSSLAHLRPKLLVSYIVRWASGMKDALEPDVIPEKSFDHYRPVLRRILSVLVIICPELRDELLSRKALLERCITSLGLHSLLSSPLDPTKMTTVHDALKNTCIHTIQCMKSAMHKLDEVGPSHTSWIRVPVQRDSMLIGAGHQRQMQVTVKEVEDRLILNKTLLDATESSVSTISGSFGEMLNSLRRRIEGDKDIVFCLAELRREIPGQTAATGCAVLPLLKQLIRGCETVVGAVEEVAPVLTLDESESCDDRSKDLQQKNGRDLEKIDANNLSGICEDQGTAGSGKNTMADVSATLDRSRSNDQYRLEIKRLKKEAVLMKQQLATCQQTVVQLQDREKNLVERLSTQAQNRLEKSSTKFEDINLGINRPTQLIRRYGNLYAESRVNVLDALDELSELDGMDDLKTKLLFSIVILAFRSAEKTLKDVRCQLMKLMGVSGDLSNFSTQRTTAVDPSTKDVESSLMLYLRKTAEKKDLSESIQEVCDQVWQTLYDYPCLKECLVLMSFISESVRLAWALAIQHPCYTIEFESRRFASDRHTHFHTSNSDSDIIRSYVWPGLREGEDGPVVYRGVVVT